MKKIKIKQSKQYGNKAKVFTEYGIFFVFLSTGIRDKFTIGNIEFNAIGGYASNGFKTDKPIPESWTIDLSASILEEQAI